MANRVQVSADNDVIDGLVVAYTLFSIVHHFGELTHATKNASEYLNRAINISNSDLIGLIRVSLDGTNL